MRAGCVSHRDTRLVKVERAAFRRVRVALIPEVGAKVGVIHLTRAEARELSYVLRAVADS